MLCVYRVAIAQAFYNVFLVQTHNKWHNYGLNLELACTKRANKVVLTIRCNVVMCALVCVFVCMSRMHSFTS